MKKKYILIIIITILIMFFTCYFIYNVVFHDKKFSQNELLDLIDGYWQAENDSFYIRVFDKNGKYSYFSYVSGFGRSGKIKSIEYKKGLYEIIILLNSGLECNTDNCKTIKGINKDVPEEEIIINLSIDKIDKNKLILSDKYADIMIYNYLGSTFDEMKKNISNK